MLIVFCIFFAAGALLWPENAHAWGPGMHLELAQNALTNIDLWAPAISKLIGRYPNDFIYGAVSPDIFLNKMRAGYLYHCHNWRMGHLLLAEAKTDKLRASVYGYLTHLAADVVAHNYFVPFKIVRSYRSPIANHPYWEMRFDLSVPTTTWEAIPPILQGDYQEFDELLEKVLKKTLFSFKTSKKIFKSILVLHKLKTMQTTLQNYAKGSKHVLKESRIKHFRDLAYESVHGFLKDPINAPCLLGDPTGHSCEVGAHNLAKRMRRARRRNDLSPESIDRLISLCDRRLRDSMYKVGTDWPAIYDVL